MATESRFRLLGLPLVHIASGRVENGQYHRGVAPLGACGGVELRAWGGGHGC